MKIKTTKRHTNRKMGDDTYKLRRQVMDCIYAAKALLGGKMDRVDVRITDCTQSNVLGTAEMGGRIIWIPAATLETKHVRQVVFHELLHAIFAVEHVKGCPLMGATLVNMDDATTDSLFVDYATAACNF